MEKHEFIIKSKLKVNKTAPKDAQPEGWGRSDRVVACPKSICKIQNGQGATFAPNSFTYFIVSSFTVGQNLLAYLQSHLLEDFNELPLQNVIAQGAARRQRSRKRFWQAVQFRGVASLRFALYQCIFLATLTVSYPQALSLPPTLYRSFCLSLSFVGLRFACSYLPSLVTDFSTDSSFRSNSQSEGPKQSFLRD